MIGWWINRMLDKISEVLYRKDPTDEFWDGEEGDNNE
jgi:hypothetical protein